MSTHCRREQAWLKSSTLKLRFIATSSVNWLNCRLNFPVPKKWVRWWDIRIYTKSLLNINNTLDIPVTPIIIEMCFVLSVLAGRKWNGTGTDGGKWAITAVPLTGPEREKFGVWRPQTSAGTIAVQNIPVYSLLLFRTNVRTNQNEWKSFLMPSLL